MGRHSYQFWGTPVLNIPSRGYHEATCSNIQTHCVICLHGARPRTMPNTLKYDHRGLQVEGILPPMPAVSVMASASGSLALRTPYQSFPKRPTQGFAEPPGEARTPCLVTHSLPAFPSVAWRSAHAGLWAWRK